MDIFEGIFEGPIDVDPEYFKEWDESGAAPLPEDYLDWEWEDDIPF